MKKKSKEKERCSEGTIRIKAKTLDVVKKTKKGWTKTTKFNTENIKEIVHKYKTHANFNHLISNKNKTFLKGEITIDGKIRGEKITELPDGRKLDGMFSLFAPHLTIHDEKTNDHWDVIYQNPNKSYAHLYTKEKIKKSKKKKFKTVHEFEKELPKLQKKLKKALKEGDQMALPLYTLISTYMRVGNIHSYLTKGHKGLTTLNKKDIEINDKKNHVTFDYIGKDGVPQKTTTTFPKVYVVSLKGSLKPKKKDDFAFHHKTGNHLRDTHLEDAFEKYTGKRFYPHIVRSYYATKKVQEFLKNNKNPSKQDIKNLYNDIANTLGHKKFNKKNQEWKPSHTVTVAHYIDPELIEKINQIILSHQK